MLTKVDARRRWFGMLFLILSGGMLAWGLTFLKQFLFQNPLLFLLYWLVCFTFTILALVIAAIDMRAIRQRSKEEKRRLFHSAFRDDENSSSGKK